MPSQAPQAPQAATSLAPIVLPLAKYSYVTVASDHAAPLPWTHMSEDKLFAIFTTIRIESSGDVETQQRIRIVRDSSGSIMEDLDLGELARQARLNVEQIEGPKTAQKLDVYVIVRPPTLAMRFPRSHEQTHRFQIRFSQEQDYYRALSMFAAEGCPLNEAGPSSPARSAQRPSSAAPSIARPNESEPTSERNHHSKRRREQLESADSAQASGAASSANSASAPQLISHLPVHDAPTAAQDTSKENRASVQGQVTRAPISDRPSSSAPERLTASNPRLDFATSSQQRRLENIIYQPQPSTAPEYRSQSNMLPPRRELPFSRRAAHPRFTVADEAQIEQRDLGPATPVEIPQQEINPEQPSPAKRAKKAPAKKTATTTTKKSSTTRRKADATTAQSAIPSVEELLKMDDRVFASRKRQYEPPLPILVARSPTTKDMASKTLPDVDQRGDRLESKDVHKQTDHFPNTQSTYQETHSTMEDVVFDSQESRQGLNKQTNRNARARGSPKPSIRAPLQESRSTNVPTATTKMVPDSDEMRALLLKEPGFSASPSDITRYADLEEGERRATLEAFMCEQLDDPAFHTLCKDVSRMWQTILFGCEFDES